MGMDVYGRAPTSERGEYFRASVWGWHPLWTMVENLVPDLAQKVEHGHTNDGDGLDAEDAAELSRRLSHLIDAGVVAEYVKTRDEVIAALPAEECEWCNGTGVRRDAVGRSMGMPDRNWCNGCDGKGQVQPLEAHFVLDEERVIEFTEFLRDSGGFNIH